MKHFFTLGMISIILSLAVLGCNSGDSGGDHNEDIGVLSLPLVASGPSGIQYRLRDAVFEISRNYQYDYQYTGGDGLAGAGGAPAPIDSIVVSSEDDKDASNIEVDLEGGEYTIYLHPGWYMEIVENSGARRPRVSSVEATLLSSNYQWIYIYPHSTSWTSYEFGIGEKSIWLNGKLNINVDVYENPDDYYGDYGGYGGTTTMIGGAGGTTMVGGAGGTMAPADGGTN